MMSIGYLLCILCCIFFSCHFLIHSFICLACHPCHAATDTPEEPKVAAVPTELIAPIPAIPNNSLSFFSLCISPLLFFLCPPFLLYFPTRNLCDACPQVHCLLRGPQVLCLRLGVVLPQFLTLRARPFPSLFVLT